MYMRCGPRRWQTCARPESGDGQYNRPQAKRRERQTGTAQKGPGPHTDPVCGDPVCDEGTSESATVLKVKESGASGRVLPGVLDLMMALPVVSSLRIHVLTLTIDRRG